MNKPQKIAFILLTVLMTVFLFFKPAYAHPGRTASDGCHYCRTNCASWGEVSGARHCHGGGGSQPVVPPPQSPTPAAPIIIPPSPSPTLSPLFSPSPSPSPTLSPNPSPSPSLEPEPPSSESKPSPSSEVKGEAVKKEEPNSILGNIGALAILGGLGWGGYKLLKKLFQKEGRIEK